MILHSILHASVRQKQYFGAAVIMGRDRKLLINLQIEFNIQFVGRELIQTQLQVGLALAAIPVYYSFGLQSIMLCM